MIIIRDTKTRTCIERERIYEELLKQMKNGLIVLRPDMQLMCPYEDTKSVKIEGIGTGTFDTEDLWYTAKYISDDRKRKSIGNTEWVLDKKCGDGIWKIKLKFHGNKVEVSVKDEFYDLTVFRITYENIIEFMKNWRIIDD